MAYEAYDFAFLHLDYDEVPYVYRGVFISIGTDEVFRQKTDPVEDLKAALKWADENFGGTTFFSGDVDHIVWYAVPELTWSSDYELVEVEGGNNGN